MGENWVKVRNGAGDGTLRTGDADVRDVAARWDQFVEYLCLGLGQDLGRDVRPVRPRKQTTAGRLEAHARALAEDGMLDSAIRVPDAAGDLLLKADLRARRVVTAVNVDAPSDGRPVTRVRWLLRQLKEAPDGLVIEASFVNTKATAAALLGAANDDPAGLLLANDPKRLPRSFRLALSTPMGTKRGKGERSFVLETRLQAIDFYRNLVQNLRPWRPAPPKLPEETADTAHALGTITPPEQTSRALDSAEAEPSPSTMRAEH